MAGNTARAGATVTSRMLAILASFDEEHRQQSLTETAHRSDLSLSTTHRLVAELTGWGALRRRSTGGYVIGRRLRDVGLLAPVQTGLRETTSPFLNNTYAATLGHLAVRDPGQALYLDRLSAPRRCPW